MSEPANVEAIGPHKLLCGDITRLSVAQLMGDERADVIYSDPPWGPGNQQYWHTMRERGAAPRTSWEGFLAAFCRTCATHRTPDAPVFVEMGMRWASELDEVMRSVGLPKQRSWVFTYGPKAKPLPLTLTLYGPRNVDVTMPEPAHGEPVTREVLRSVVRPGALVLDPCTGLGMTARWTHKLGGHFRGTEMNASRLERTAAWLRKNAT
jgi:hypothetical protein